MLQKHLLADVDLLNNQRSRSGGSGRNSVSFGTLGIRKFVRSSLDFFASFLFNVALQLLKITEKITSFDTTVSRDNRMDNDSVTTDGDSIITQRRHDLLKEMFTTKDYAAIDSKLGVDATAFAADTVYPAEDKLSLSIPRVSIRKATISDTGLILTFIKELARFEEMESSVVASVELLQESLFPSALQTVSNAEVVILEINGQPAGFALYFFNFSTFLGKKGLYIEDLYVREQYRGKTYGKQLLKHVCQIAQKKNCGRVEWWCLDWNEQAINFYIGLGAEAMKDWTVFRLSEDKIRDIGSMPMSMPMP
jgi:GNAT superfamily N-acetyltransferase